MLNTVPQVFQIRLVDTTVIVSGGTARIGNSFLPFDGSRITADKMVVPTDTDKYRNVLLYLQDSSGVADMTRVFSSAASSLVSLTSPVMPTSSTFTSYAAGYPLATFLTHTYTGTDSTIITWIQ